MGDLIDTLLSHLALEEDEYWDEENDRLQNAGLSGTAIYLEAQENRRHRSENRKRLYLIRNELLPNPREGTPWQRLHSSSSDRGFITTMGIDVSTFEYLLQSGFALLWNTTPIPRPDQPMTAPPRVNSRSLDPAGGLGLILHYLNSTMRDVSLMEIFALIPSTVNRYLDFCLDILLSESPDQEIENATFNGWLHEHFVSSVIAFGATGSIIACRMNAPGSWHDARVARPIFEKLRTKTPEGYYLVTDTAFPRGTDQIQGRIKAPMKSGTRLPADEKERAQVKAFDRQLLSLRQAAEWGMRGIQGSFGRLRIPLDINHVSRRGDILEACARLYQIRARRVGINQIRNVYMPIWMEGDEQRQIWEHFEDILFKDQRKLDRVARFHLIETEE
ncbi:unnamed protein product [Cyclocybe aegerita]|uniref:DDE Tnp4 domain-containing protein n=1 Tax=Cyclocybe aegerita TaxID=1973307 RepID=A0A8S0W813_CYCAE|nr:unnamed protein product [Cyclocybe aegerita]